MKYMATQFVVLLLVSVSQGQEIDFSAFNKKLDTIDLKVDAINERLLRIEEKLDVKPIKDSKCPYDENCPCEDCGPYGCQDCPCDNYGLPSYERHLKIYGKEKRPFVVWINKEPKHLYVDYCHSKEKLADWWPESGAVVAMWDKNGVLKGKVASDKVMDTYYELERELYPEKYQKVSEVPSNSPFTTKATPVQIVAPNNGQFMGSNQMGRTPMFAPLASPFGSTNCPTGNCGRR